MALQILDKVLSGETTQERLAEALREYFEADPVRFFRQIIMPLLPSEAVHKIQQEQGGFQWVSLAETIRMREAAEKGSAAPAE